MSNSFGAYLSELAESIGRSWNRFWFTPADPLPCCVLRIGVGLLLVAHFACLGIDLERWYGRNGLLSPAAVTTLLTASGEEANYRFSYLGQLAGPGELWGVHACAIAAAIMFTFGLNTRISGVLTLIALLAYVHRVPQVAGHVEPVLAFSLAYLTLAPSGACLSLDSVRRRRKRAAGVSDDSRQPVLLANIGLRLLQVHLAMFYAMMAFSKLYGDAWWDGAAVWMLLAQTQSRPLNLTSLRNAGQFGEYIINIWTQGILYFELTFPILIWNRLARPLLVALGVIVWASLILATGELLFGLTMMLANLAFMPPEFFERIAVPRGAASLPAPAMAR